MLMSASENDTEYQALLATFGDELRKMGWAQCRDIGIDYRCAYRETRIAGVI